MSGNFIIYLIGYIVAIIGVAYGLSAAGIAQEWIIAAVLILIGLGIVYALSRSQRDTPTDKPAGQATSTRQSTTTTRESGSSHDTV